MDGDRLGLRHPGRGGDGPRVTHVTTGKIVDKGIKDANNMGAAMAPAAYDTIMAHLQDTGRKPSDYDLIVTGDLGQLGQEHAGGPASAGTGWSCPTWPTAAP